MLGGRSPGGRNCWRAGSACCANAVISGGSPGITPGCAGAAVAWGGGSKFWSLSAMTFDVGMGLNGAAGLLAQPAKNRVAIPRTLIAVFMRRSRITSRAVGEVLQEPWGGRG